MVEQLRRLDHRGQGLEGLVRVLGRVEDAEGVGVELGSRDAVVRRRDRDSRQREARLGRRGRVDAAREPACGSRSSPGCPTGTRCPCRAGRCWIWRRCGMKWSFQTPSLNHFTPVVNWSVIWAVLPSAATNELAPKMVASAVGAVVGPLHVEAPLDDVRRRRSRRSWRRCRSCRRSASCRASRTASMSQGLPSYRSPTLVGGYGSLASSNSFLL